MKAKMAVLHESACGVTKALRSKTAIIKGVKEILFRAGSGGSEAGGGSQSE